MEEYDLRYIESEEDARTAGNDIFNKLLEAGKVNEKSQKEMIVHLFLKINENMNSKQSSPTSRYCSLLILRDVIENSLRPETKINKTFNALLNHELLYYLEENCNNIDPMKPIQDKGKGYFSGESEVGNNFIRCQLEIVKFLASKFQKNKNNEVTNFMKIYNKCVERGVVFPKDYKFISHNKGQKEDGGMTDSRREPKVSKAGPQPPLPGRGGPQRQKEFDFLCNRIKIYLQALQQQEEEQQLSKQISKMHQIFSRQAPKLQKQDYVNQLLQSENKDIMQKFFEVKEFIDQELTLYDKHIDGNRNLQAYISAIKPLGSRIFPKENRANATPNPGKSGSVKRTNSKQYNLGSKIKQKQEPPIKKSAFDPNTLNSLGRYFQKVEERSKSPISGGFKKINQSLSRDKAVNSMKSRISPLNRNNLSKSINSLKGSKIPAIFTNPPNQNPPPRHYEGHQIGENYAIEDSILKLNKNQGHRRFITSNFKGKSSLFENQHIQIGFKSEAIYEQVSGFRVMIKMELYFGNLTEETIVNLRLDFKGDQNILLYANPREIQRMVSKGEQNKIDLVIIPLKPKFPLLTMNLRYEVGGNINEWQILLPNSALKITHFLELPKSQFVSRWSSAELYKTTQFSLSQSLPPDTLTRWIPSLGQLTAYATFSTPGSKKDYELFTSLMMMQKYEALLKINIRPNLRVVLQIGVEDKDDESLGYFQAFLQHLQQFMKENK